MPERLRYVPVFEFDPNGRSVRVNDKLCVFIGVRSQDMVDAFLEGSHKIGDLAIAYTPYESYDDVTRTFGPDYQNDAGEGFPCRIIDWHETEPPNEGGLRMLVYLEIDPAYVILDRRESVSNDEGNSNGDGRANQGRVHGLEDPSGESGRPDGTSVAM